MTVSLDAMPQADGTPVRIGTWPVRMPGRLKNKLAGFERTIANFHQRRWS